VVRRLGHAILIGRNHLTDTDTTLCRKLWLYGLWVGVTSLLLTYPLLDVVRFGLNDGDASHIFIVPLLSAATLWLDRRAIFQSLAHDYFVGISFAVAGVATLALTHEWMGSLSDRDRSAGYMLAALLIWVSGFFLIFGQRAGRAAKFSLLLLSLAIPFSTPLLHEIVHLLQAGSAQIVAIIFNLLGVSYVRSGLEADRVYCSQPRHYDREEWDSNRDADSALHSCQSRLLVRTTTSPGRICLFFVRLDSISPDSLVTDRKRRRQASAFVVDQP
jgi:hypothetical protein